MVNSSLECYLEQLRVRPKNNRVYWVPKKTYKIQFCKNFSPPPPPQKKDENLGFNLHVFTPKPAILSILLCLMPDDLTRQWGTPRSQELRSHTCFFFFFFWGGGGEGG